MLNLNSLTADAKKALATQRTTKALQANASRAARLAHMLCRTSLQGHANLIIERFVASALHLIILQKVISTIFLPKAAFIHP